MESNSKEALEISALSIAGDTYRNRYWANNPGGHNKGKFRKLKKKCAKCGKTGGMLDIHHPSGDRKNLKDRKGLVVLCRRCHRKLHQGKGGTSSESQASYDITNMTPIMMECEDVRIINSSERDDAAFAAAGLEKQKDLLYIKFVLTHEGTNKNNDHFIREELKAATKTPILKQINWEHGEPAIGTIYKAEYKEIPYPATASFASADGKRARIECEGVVWKYKYPQYAKTIINRYQKGNLSFSMETYFSKAECSVCHEVFDSKDHTEGSYCEHLNYRNVAEGSEKAYRILRNNIFGGVACVEHPADVGAGALALAKEERKEEDSVSEAVKTYTQEEVEQAISAAIEDFKAKSSTQNELDTSKAENDQLKNELKQATETLAKLTEEKNIAIKEFEEFKISLAAKEKLNTRMAQLAEAGYEFPEKDSEDFNKFTEIISSYTDSGFEFLVQAAKKGLPFGKDMKNKDEEDEEEMKKKKKMAKASIRVPSTGLNSDEPQEGNRLLTLISKL